MAEGGLSRPSNSEFWFSLTIKKGPNTLFRGFVGPYFQEGTIGDVISKELTMRNLVQNCEVSQIKIGKPNTSSAEVMMTECPVHTPLSVPLSHGMTNIELWIHDSCSLENARSQISALDRLMTVSKSYTRLPNKK